MLRVDKLTSPHSNPSCQMCGSTGKLWLKDENNGRHLWLCNSCLSDIKAVEVPSVDTTNHFLVGLKGDDVAIAIFPALITKERAVNLAAWLVVMSDVSDEDFEALVVAIRNS